MCEAGPGGVAQGTFMVQGFPLDEHVRMILCEPKWKAYAAALRAPQVKGKVRVRMHAQHNMLHGRTLGAVQSHRHGRPGLLTRLTWQVSGHAFCVRVRVREGGQRCNVSAAQGMWWQGRAGRGRDLI